MKNALPVPSSLDHQNSSTIVQESSPDQENVQQSTSSGFAVQKDLRNKMQLFVTLLRVSVRHCSGPASVMEPSQESGGISNQLQHRCYGADTAVKPSEVSSGNASQVQQILEERRRRVWCEPSYYTEE